MIRNNLFKIFCLLIIFSFANIFGQDKFKVTRLTSNPAQEGFATWSPDGKTIIYSYSSFHDSMGKSGLWKVSLDGKEKKQICFELAEHPRWSPDGQNIVFDSDTGKSMKMISAEGGIPIRIIPDSIKIKNGGLPCWSPDGSQIVFLEGGTLSLCVENMQTKTITRIFKQEGMVPMPGCWTPDGKNILTALMELKTRKSTMWKISSDGKTKNQIFGHHDNFFRHLALSPDGSLLIYAAKEGKYLGLWIMQSEGGNSIPLAISQDGNNEGAVWSPDGKRIAFNSTRSGNFDIWIMDIDVEQVKKELQELGPKK